MTDVADVLDGAADLIEERGWRQGPTRRLRRQRWHSLCLAEALALTARATNWPLQARALDVLSIHVFGQVMGGDHLVRWNDQRGRTKDEVIEALRKTAQDQRNGERCDHRSHLPIP